MGIAVVMSKGPATHAACPIPIILADPMLLVMLLLPLDPLLATLGQGLLAPKAVACLKSGILVLIHSWRQMMVKIRLLHSWTGRSCYQYDCAIIICHQCQLQVTRQLQCLMTP